LEQIRQAIRPHRLANENRELRQAVSLPAPPQLFIGNSQGMKRLLEQIHKVALSDSTVLLTGETGTGKTTFARLIHGVGTRDPVRFIYVNCSTLPANLIEDQLFGHVKGAFTDAVSDRMGHVELADGGTLFLDEVGDLPLELQPKLLTFLQDRTFQRIGDPRSKQVDVRVIAATNKDLDVKVAERSFRADLYYRLNVLPLVVPPLRDRPEDIPLFADFVLQRLAQKRGGAKAVVAADAMQAIQLHRWPGNIRELENVLDRAATFCEDGVIGGKDLDLGGAAPAPGPTGLAGLTLEEIERLAIVGTLKATGGNKKAAAQMLGIDEKSIYNKMKRLGLG
jgi:transcriptional regulator with GAF, ATPase, and Fis domain